MKTVLYTPAHNPYFDTLIMAGIVVPTITYCYEKVFNETLDENEALGYVEKLFTIEFTGREFVIKTSLDINELAEAISSFVGSKVDSIVGDLMNVNAIQKQVVKTATQILRLLSDKKTTAEYLEDLSSRFHAIRSGEGRKRGGKRGKVKQKVVWLVLSPNLGKFATSLFKSKAEPYNACINCIGVALLGLYSISMRTNRGGTALIIFPSFDGLINGVVLFKYNRYITEKFEELTTKLRMGLDNIPDSLLAMYAFSKLSLDILELMKEQKAVWYSFTTKLVKGATQLRGFNVIKIDSLIDAMVSLSNINEELMRLIDTLIDYSNKSSDVVDSLYLLYKYFDRRDENSYYDLLRTLRRTLDRIERPALLSLTIASHLSQLMG